MTGVNTLSLVSKRMLEHFLKTSPLKNFKTEKKNTKLIQKKNFQRKDQTNDRKLSRSILSVRKQTSKRC